MELRQKSILTLAQVDGSSPAMYNLNIPDMLDEYHSLFPLERFHEDERPSDILGVNTFSLKAISCNDGQPHLLRRLDGRFVAPTTDLMTIAHEVVDRWSAVSSHPSILIPKGIFVSREIRDVPCLFIVSDYKPGAITLVCKIHMFL